MKKLRVLCLVLFSLVMVYWLTSSAPRSASAQDLTNDPTQYDSPTWTAGKTSVSDLMPAEKKQRLGYVIPEWYKQWWESAPKIEAPSGAKFDPVFDWRTHPGPYGTTGVTPVKDQGGCGSCWAFAAVGHLESMVKIYGEVELDLSEQQCVSCLTPGSGCDGYYSEACYDLFRTQGAISEVCMPYHAVDTDPCIQNQCQKWAKISGYTAVANNVSSIKQALLSGPVKTSMAVEDTFFSYRGGCYNRPYFDINHAVLIVGWNDTMCGGQGAWIVKNSWGSGWGDHGFYYIKWGLCQVGNYSSQITYVFHRPRIRLENYGLDDSVGGDGDGRVEPGETVRINFALKNLWSALGNVSVTVTADTSGIVITDGSSYLGNMASKDIKNNSSDPMQFQVPADFPPRRIFFTFHVSGDSGGGVIYRADTTVMVSVGLQILVVDDDHGVNSLGTNYEDYYTKALDSLKAVYDIWDKSANLKTGYNWSDFDILIWFTGDHRDSIFSDTDIESLMTFLDHGGRLFLTSQDVAEVLSSSSDPLDTTFLKNYLHVRYNGNCAMHLVAGSPGDEVGDSLWIFPESTPGANNQTSKDNLAPDSLAQTVLSYAQVGFNPTDSVAGIKFQGDFKLVYFGFGFEAINSSGNYFHGHWLSKPELVMQNVLNWLKIPWRYLPGDANGDEIVNLGDVVFLISYLYKSGSAPTPISVGDINGDCSVDLGDVVYLISYLYKAGPIPREGCTK